MNTTMWLDLLNEGIPLLLLIALGIALYQGLKKNHALLAEREDLLKRYLIFRGNKQIRLKMLEEEEKSHQELLKNISTSWKHFKKTYDQYLTSFHQNTAQTKLMLQIITLGLLINSLRGVIGDYLLTHSKIYLLFTIVRELSSYVLVILSFLLLRVQTHRLRLSKWKVAEMDREILFFPNNLSEADSEGLYNEFDPLEVMKAEDGKKDQDHHGGAEG
ncbi:MAG: hypothetical protein MUO29_09920 [Desulfobacterales bacterium]|jgi:hypothetical protein|nr:hypothetical protein [Desulfobacterales bacterium]